jgi:hypothetical protein
MVDDSVQFFLLNSLQIESLKMFCNLSDTQNFTKAEVLQNLFELKQPLQLCSSLQ